MGWLEILALLKRLLPLLSRVAPMLETYIATRGAMREDVHTAFDRFSGELKGDLSIASQNHAEVKRTLADHTEHLLVLSDDIKQLRITSSQSAARLEEAEKQIAGMSRMLRTVSILMVVLLLACVGLLVALFLRH